MGFHIHFNHPEKRERSSCSGVISTRDLERWVMATVQNGAQSYASLIDGRKGELVLDPYGYRRFSQLMRGLAQEWRFGPVAVVVGDERTATAIHTLGLMMQSTCPVRAFWQIDEAEQWLETQVAPAPTLP